MEDVLIIVNPAAAGGRTGRRWAGIEQQLRQAGLNFDVAFTTPAGRGTDLAREAVKGSRPIVAAAGGDGTLNEVLNGFFEAGDPIPTSSALAWSPWGREAISDGTFGLGSDPVDIAGFLRADQRRMIDAGRITLRGSDGGEVTRHFVNIADAGLGGEVSSRVNDGLRVINGTISFFLASLLAGLTWRNKPMHVVIDGDPRDLIVQQVVVANCRYLRGGILVAPSALADDGLLDVVLLGDFGLLEGTPLLGQLRTRRPPGQPQGHPPARQAGRGPSSSERVPGRHRRRGPGRAAPRVFEVQPAVVSLVVPRASWPRWWSTRTTLV